MKIDGLQQSHIEKYCRDNDIDLLIVFGSYATGRVRPSSDLDIALLFKNRSRHKDKLKLIFELEGIFEKQVDLVILTPLTDPLLRYEIFFSGVPIFKRNETIFDEGKLHAWKMYVDTKKIRDMRKMLYKNYIRKLKDEFRSHPS